MPRNRKAPHQDPLHFQELRSDGRIPNDIRTSTFTEFPKKWVNIVDEIRTLRKQEKQGLALKRLSAQCGFLALGA